MSKGARPLPLDSLSTSLRNPWDEPFNSKIYSSMDAIREGDRVHMSYLLSSGTYGEEFADAAPDALIQCCIVGSARGSYVIL